MAKRVALPTIKGLEASAVELAEMHVNSLRTDLGTAAHEKALIRIETLVSEHTDFGEFAVAAEDLATHVFLAETGLRTAAISRGIEERIRIKFCAALLRGAWRGESIQAFVEHLRDHSGLD